MLVSLIVTTREGRTREVITLLESLRESVHRNFEVILVAQDCADSLAPVADRYRQDFPIRFLRHARCGISQARNAALPCCSGEIIGFPDDDCWYPKETLGRIDDFFQRAPATAFACTAVIDPLRKLPFGHRRTAKQDTPIDLSNAFTLPVSVGIFVNRRQIEPLHFDESLGAGANWGSGEETDLILSLLRGGRGGVFLPGAVVYHRINYEATDALAIEKALRYARGFGAVTAKSLCLRKQYATILFYLEILLRTTARAIVSGLRLDGGNGALHLARAEGMLQGFLEGLRFYAR